MDHDPSIADAFRLICLVPAFHLAAYAGQPSRSLEQMNPVEQRTINALQQRTTASEQPIKDVGEAMPMIIINQPPRDYHAEMVMATIGAVGIVLGACVPVILRLRWGGERRSTN